MRDGENKIDRISDGGGPLCKDDAGREKRGGEKCGGEAVGEGEKKGREKGCEALGWVIYVLKSPRTNEVRYVGWTSRPPEKRLQVHIGHALASPMKNHRHRWVASLVSVGLYPLIEIVETGSGPLWEESERRWIAFYRSNGARLVNGTDGGEGCPGRGTPEQRSAIAKKGHASMTPQQRSDRQRKAQAGLTPEQRSAAARKGAAKISSERRRALLFKAHSEKTAEERAAIGKKAAAKISTERRAAMATANMAAKTPEQRSAAARKGAAKISTERRRAAAKLGWTRKRAISGAGGNE